MDKPMTFNEWMGKQGNLALVHANCCRIAFEGGQQSQQAKIEELQKQLSEYIFVAETIDEMYVKEVKSSEELQKRVQILIQKYKDEDRELKLIDEWEKSQIYGRIAIEIEQALKGEGQ